MNFELLIATMHKSVGGVLEMLDESNVHCNVLVVVQTDYDDYEEFRRDRQWIRIIFTTERGLSNSRNMALANSEADVVLLADDDLVYFDQFDKTIVNEFYDNPGYDFIVFNVENYARSYPSLKQKVRWHNLFNYTSWQIAFKRKKVEERQVCFDPDFGAGSGVYSSGEENIFFTRCFRFSRMIYVPDKILSRPQTSSSWLAAYDERYLFDRGAIFYAIAPRLVYFLILQFCLRRKALFPHYGYFEMIGYMLDGKRDCKARKLAATVDS